jgi:cytoskeletal protein CcmA (bactofilin family)
MFGKDKNAAGSGRGQRGCVSVIGADVVITGDIVATDELRVDGRIEGNVRCRSLEQGAGGFIAGDIEAEAARLAGTIEGEVSVAALVLEAGARISGDVCYDSLSIAPGARIDGRFAHRAALAKSATGDAPAPLRSASAPPPDELFVQAAE